VPELLRPEPPRSLLDRARSALAVVHPARLATGTGALLLLVAAGWWLLRPSRPPVEDQLPRASTTSSVVVASAVATPASTVATEVVVQVAGAVAHPGVYRLASGARVMDLVDAAGGAVADADLEAMSLAARLVDGQRVQVPHRGEVLPASATGAPPSSGVDRSTNAAVPTEPVDVNTAGLDELDALPGVGPAIAQAIIAYRTKHGPFPSVEDLAEVPGIGAAKLDALRDLVRV
jgi:competence protein ComEA